MAEMNFRFILNALPGPIPDSDRKIPDFTPDSNCLKIAWRWAAPALVGRGARVLPCWHRLMRSLARQRPQLFSGTRFARWRIGPGDARLHCGRFDCQARLGLRARRSRVATPAFDARAKDAAPGALEIAGHRVKRAERQHLFELRECCGEPFPAVQEPAKLKADLLLIGGQVLWIKRECLCTNLCGAAELAGLFQFSDSSKQRALSSIAFRRLGPAQDALIRIEGDARHRLWSRRSEGSHLAARSHGMLDGAAGRFETHFDAHIEFGRHVSKNNFAGNLDRKSTRLNSSHGYISYAVFCLKKKKKQLNVTSRHNDSVVLRLAKKGESAAYSTQVESRLEYDACENGLPLRSATKDTPTRDGR